MTEVVYLLTGVWAGELPRWGQLAKLTELHPEDQKK